MENKFVILTEEQLKGLLDNALNAAKGTPAGGAETHTDSVSVSYVYGLRGICELFSVSHATAQKYKDTFLAPAVYQRGRKIMVDAGKAVELFKQYQAQ